MLRRALLNLILNAVDVMPDGGELLLDGTMSQQHVELIVADTGPGFTGDVASRLFEPFFTTKGKGTGLGLAIVERIAEVHGGEIKAENREGGGATFKLLIPI
jgi:signal transduction histidine kinase